MITKVTRSVWTLKNDGRTYWAFKVYYAPTNRPFERVVTYDWTKNLPQTVLEFVLNASHVETRYIPEDQHSLGITGVKRETYTA